LTAYLHTCYTGLGGGVPYPLFCLEGRTALASPAVRPVQSSALARRRGVRLTPPRNFGVGPEHWIGGENANEAMSTALIDTSSSPAFDYSPLEPSTRTTLQTYAQRLGSLAQDAAVGMWEMGKLLSEAQGKLASYGDGTFQRWVEAEAGLSLSTSYRLLNIHRRFVRSTLEQTPLATSALYILSEPATPQEARDEAVYRAERGEVITKAAAQGIVAQYRPLAPP